LESIKRIAIIGPGGAGKSTLARQIGAALSLPVIHLDAHYWHEGWMETPKEVWEQTVPDSFRARHGSWTATMAARWTSV